MRSFSSSPAAYLAERRARLVKRQGLDAAAIEAMKALGVYDAIQPKIVMGASIAQAFGFIDTKNAEVPGFES